MDRPDADMSRRASSASVEGVDERPALLAPERLKLADERPRVLGERLPHVGIGERLAVASDPVEHRLPADEPASALACAVVADRFEELFGVLDEYRLLVVERREQSADVPGDV